ncbi:MAG: hypothetical protein KKF50_05345 [Nanoarchaeota archaeon]|nr:hypothetical protein [Nanoarchaeota archaeon]
MVSLSNMCFVLAVCFLVFGIFSFTGCKSRISKSQVQKLQNKIKNLEIIINEPVNPEKYESCKAVYFRLSITQQMILGRLAEKKEKGIDVQILINEYNSLNLGSIPLTMDLVDYERIISAKESYEKALRQKKENFSMSLKDLKR